MNSISDDDDIMDQHHHHHQQQYSESYPSNDDHHYNHHHHHHQNGNHHVGSNSVVVDGCFYQQKMPHSAIYPAHQDCENSYQLNTGTCIHPSRNEHGGTCDFSSVTESEYSTSSTDIDLDHNHTDKKSNVYKNYFNHNTEGKYNDNIGIRYRDGCDYWTEKMNAYHSSKSNAISATTVATVVVTTNTTKTNNGAVTVDTTNNIIPTTTTTTTNTNNSHRPTIIGAVSCYTPPPCTTYHHHKMIEVAPGEYMRLRGAQETWEAVQNDFYIPGTCICCHRTIFCIQDAMFVLCPICNVISPSHQPPDNNSGTKILISNEYNGGVGLGFLIDELIQWQNDILASRKSSRK